MLPQSDTIVARATNPGQSAISVIRLSGSQALQLANTITGGKMDTAKPNHTVLKQIRSGADIMDEALVTLFKGPHSFTGEDVVEISLHGSDFISAKVIKMLLQEGARLAKPGEFTMRAYLNGKLDLAQAEAVADVISAQTESEHRLAMSQLKGGVSSKIKELRQRILEFAALVELELDFGEEDVEFADRSKLRGMVVQLGSEVEILLNTFGSGNAIKEGIPVAIVGKPNAGKSTLLNVLVGEDRAIVTDIPGTTRDTIEEMAVVGGLRFRFIDTAGIREAENLVEKIGIERTFKSIEKATLVWLVVDLSASTIEEIKEALETVKANTKAQIWVIGNKSDLLKTFPVMQGLDIVQISAKKMEISVLMQKLESYAQSLLGGIGDTTITNLRHFEVLKKSLEKINGIVNALDGGYTADMLAHHMREAMAELGAITGEIDNDEVLGEIFGKFCIGK